MSNSTEIKNDYDIEKWKLFLENSIGNDALWLKVLLASILISIFIIGLIGNVLTCAVIYYDKKMHTTTNYYLFNMAVSDLMVSFGIFLEVYLYVTDTYIFGQVVCKIHFVFVVMLWNNSILVVTTLAIERYIAIWRPWLLKSVPSLKRVTKILVVIWIIALCETVPEMFTVELVKTDTVSVCFTVPSSLARIVNGVLALLTFIIPLTIMIFVYTMIAFKVNINEKMNSERKIFNHKDNRKKVNKLVVAITLSCFICWLPFFCFRLLVFFYDMKQLTRLGIWNIIYRTCLINSWLSIILNPILFSLMSTKFRKALKMIWRKEIKRQTEAHL